MSFFPSTDNGPVNKILSHHLSANGDGTGNINFNGDYSSTQEIAYIQPGASEIFRIHRMIATIEDTSGFSAEEYGNLGSALTNGLGVRKQDNGGTIINLTNGQPIKTNAEWGEICYDVDLKTWGAGSEYLLVRWTFRKSGHPIRLVGANNERLEVTLDDDLTGLVKHHFLVQGNIESSAS